MLPENYRNHPIVLDLSNQKVYSGRRQRRKARARIELGVYGMFLLDRIIVSITSAWRGSAGYLLVSPAREQPIVVRRNASSCGKALANSFIRISIPDWRPNPSQ
jgi:hypothetical protein